MNNQLPKLGVLAASVAIGFAVVEINPAEAFVPYYQYNFSLGKTGQEGSGVLTFTNRSKITGIGTEILKLSEIQGAILDYTAYVPETGYDEIEKLEFNSWNSDPILTFNSGNLVGIELTDTASFGGSYCSSGGPCGGSSGANYFDLMGDKYQKAVRGTDYIYIVDYDPETGEEIYDDYTDKSFGYIASSGTIIFDNVLPVQPIPEPLTIFGTSVAIGFGSFFKRKLAKK